jgi:hypothetical protein
MGGHKNWDLRRVRLNSSVEEQQWRAAVEESDWMPDGVVSTGGARGVALADLVQARKEQ